MSNSHDVRRLFLEDTHGLNIKGFVGCLDGVQINPWTLPKTFSSIKERVVNSLKYSDWSQHLKVIYRARDNAKSHTAQRWK